MKHQKTIKSVVEVGLCTGCGTCAALCPNNAIQIIRDNSKGIYIPKINQKKCDKCGICYRICPGHKVDFNGLNLEIFGKKPKDVIIGNYLNCYIGHALDYNIRYNSSSGGLITALLIYGLEEGIIDGALVTKMSIKNPLKPQPFIARTKEEIISASKSKYCPVPANIGLKEILQSDGKFAIVGLPCHLHGIRKAEQLNEKLKEKIVLHLGLFCGHTPNFWGTKLFLKRMRIKEDALTKLDYRGEGWPGFMKINSHGRTWKILLPDYWRFVGLDFFTPLRCLMCYDGLNEFADISFGDAWLPDVKDNIGKSIIISRTPFGEKFLNRATHLLEFNKVTTNEVKLSQLDMLHFKKEKMASRLWLFQKKPNYNIYLLTQEFKEKLFSFIPYFNHLISQNSLFRKLLEIIPMKFLYLYNTILSMINSNS